MGEKDITQKTLESFADVFADLLNALLFGGQQLVDERDLTAALPRSQLKMGTEIHDQERDSAMYWKSSTFRIALFGLENQSEEDETMPARVISYDGASYKEMLAKKLTLGPVATLVLHFGHRHRWNKPKELLGCFDVPERLASYVSDYKINVFDIAFLSPEQISLFKSDFRFVAEFLRCERTGDEFDPDKLGVITHVRELLQLMSAFTGDRSFEEHYNEKTMKDGETRMSMVMQSVRNAGIAEGRTVGIAEGRTIGIAEGEARGESNTYALLRQLADAGRQSDIMRAISDESYFHELMRAHRGGETN